MRKEVLILTTAIMCTTALCGCTAEQAASSAQEVANSVQTALSPEVMSVKNAYLSEYSNEVTVGDAFDNFLSEPMWEYFVAETGEDVVQCTGKCTYNDKTVEAKIQFILNDDDTFEVYILSLNDIEQNKLMLAGFLNKVYEGVQGDTSNETEQTDEPDTTVENTYETPEVDNTPQTTSQATDYKTIYGDIVSSINDEYTGSAEYALYDIDGNGTEELLISYGDSDADYVMDAYTVDNGSSVYLGQYSYGNSLVYVAEDGNGLYAIYSHMDYVRMDRLTTDGDSLFVDNVYEIEGGIEDYTGGAEIIFHSADDDSALG